MRGSKRERSPGVWELRVYLGRDPVTGRDRYRSRTHRGGQRSADRALAELVTEAGETRAATEGTFGHLLDEWLRLVERDRSPTTAAGYRSKIRTYLRPELGDVPLEKLTARHLDQLYERLSARGLAPATVHAAHRIARTALGQAVRWEWIPANPAAHATPPSVRRRDEHLPDLDRLRALLVEVQADDPDLATIWAVTAALGCRRGEVLGLQWRDLDWQAGTVVIRRAVVEADGRWLVKDTKTHRARRVAVDADTLELLARRRARAEALAEVAEVGLRVDGFVFSRDGDGGRPVEPSRVSKRWRRAADAHGLEGVRLHDLRHLAASILLAKGVDVVEVARRLGHGRVSTTFDIYSHAMPGQDRVAADVLGAALGLPATPVED